MVFKSINPITNTQEYATEYSRLVKFVTRVRDSYIIQNTDTLSLGTAVRHAVDRGIAIVLTFGENEIVIHDRESMKDALRYMIEMLKGSFLIYHDYIVWLVEVAGLNNDNVVSQWKCGSATPKMSVFMKILNELDGTISLRSTDGEAK